MSRRAQDGGLQGRRRISSEHRPEQSEARCTLPRHHQKKQKRIDPDARLSCTCPPNVERVQPERWVATVEPAARHQEARAVDVEIVVHHVSSACEWAVAKGLHNDHRRSCREEVFWLVLSGVTMG